MLGNNRDYPGDEQVLFVVPQAENPLLEAAVDADYIEGRVHDDRRHLLAPIAGAEATVLCQGARRCLQRIAEWGVVFRRDDGVVTEVQEPILLGGYAAKQCPVRVQNDFLPLVQTLKWVPSPEDQARLDAGIAFERIVFDDLVEVHPTAVVVDPQLGKADAIAMTVEAMNADAPLVLGGWLPDDIENGRTGRPDILIKADRGYLPADVKNHLTLKPLKTETVTRAFISALASPNARFGVPGWTTATTHRYEDGLQLAHYTRMLEACGFHPGAEHLWGAVLGTSQLETTAGHGLELVLVWHNLDEPLFFTFSRSQGKARRSLLERYDHEHGFRIKVAETAGESPAAVMNRSPWWNPSDRTNAAGAPTSSGARSRWGAMTRRPRSLSADLRAASG